MDVNSKYLIMLDTLMDTRLGTILQQNNEYIGNIKPDEYMARVDDTVLARYNPEFNELWRRRTTEVLEFSMRTYFVNKALEDIVGDQRDAHMAFPDRTYTLDINIWPYSANEEERVILKEVMQALFPTIETINIVYVSLQQMSPAWMCAMNYTMVAMYEFVAWVDYHRNAFANEERYDGPLIVGPRLKDPKLVDIDINSLPQTVRDVIAKGKEWELVEAAFGERLAVRLYPAWYFSSVMHAPAA